MADQHDTHDDRVERVEEQERLSEAPGQGVSAPAADRAGDARSTMSPKELPADDVEARSRLAASLDRGAFPGDREALLESARRNDAPAELKERLAALPDGEYRNVEEVWAAIGGHGEPPH